MPENARILLKFPTRERPQKAIETVKRYIQLAADNDNIVYLISIDTDDLYTNNKHVVDAFEALNENVICVADRSRNKVHAYNRDIELIEDWQILVDASDDMVCIKKGWDNTIRKDMERFYPDTDGILHYNDGFTGQKLITLPIIGHKYYERFGYVYHPSYNSLWCDNEQMEVARRLKKIKYIDTVLFRHEHFSNMASVKRDALICKTESYFNIDKRNYNRRLRLNFDL